MSDRKVLQHDWVVRGFGVRSERSARVTAKHTIFWEPSALVRIYKDAGRAPQSLICKVFEGCECWNQSCLLFICKSGSFHKKNASTVGVHNCTTFTALLCKLNTTSTAAYICWNNSRKTKTLRNQNQLSEAVALGAPPVCFLKSF